MTYPNSKEEITRKILAEIGDDPDSPWKDIPVDKLMFAWWTTGRSGSGLRLTDPGRNAFEYAKIAHYDLPFDGPKDLSGAPSTGGWSMYSLELDKKIKCPYYLGTEIVDKKRKPFIRIYDHRIAVMMTLYGDTNSYLESIRLPK
jgi:hypothetical protein